MFWVEMALVKEAKIHHMTERLAKWPDKICECVRVNCLNCKMETRTIECVAFFYHEGAKGDDFIQKNKFRCCVDSSQWGSVVKLREHVR